MNIFENPFPLLIFILIIIYIVKKSSSSSNTPTTKPQQPLPSKRPPSKYKYRGSSPTQSIAPSPQAPNIKLPPAEIESKNMRLGREGEEKIGKIMERFGELILLRSVYLPQPKGRTTEVDMIALTSKGIVIIESKNFSGWIFGTDTDDVWTQTFADGGKKTFHNPILQNLTHMNSLARYLKMDLTHFYSFVIFGDRCTLKKIVVDHHEALVFSLADLLPTMKEFFQELDDVFTRAELDRMKKALDPCCNVSQEVKDRHLHYVQSRYGTSNNNNKNTNQSNKNKQSNAKYNQSNKNTNYNQSNKNTNYNQSNKNTNYNQSNKNTNYNQSNKNTNYNQSNKNTNYNQNNNQSITKYNQSNKSE